MAYLQKGKAYFGSIFVPAGVKMPKLSETSKLFPDWRWPTASDVSNLIFRWYNLYGEQGPIWWDRNNCAGVFCKEAPEDGGESEFECRVPWPELANCGEFELNDPSASFNRYIPGTITGITRDLSYLPADKQEYLKQYNPPPAPGDPGAYKDLTPYDRTWWFASEWLGPTGEHDLTYVDPATGLTCYVYELRDGDDGSMVVTPSEPANDSGWQSPFPHLSATSPPKFERRPDYGAFIRKPEESSASKFPWGWVLGIGTAAVVGVAAYKMRTKV